MLRSYSYYPPICNAPTLHQDSSELAHNFTGGDKTSESVSFFIQFLKMYNSVEALL